MPRKAALLLALLPLAVLSCSRPAPQPGYTIGACPDSRMGRALPPVQRVFADHPETRAMLILNGGCRALLVNLFEARGGHPEDVAERVSLFTARFGGESDRFAREVSLVLFPPPAAAPDADLPLRVAVEAIARVAGSRPVVLWLEDVQWSRLEAVALVCAVSMHDPPLPVAIVATARIEEMPRRTQYDALVAELSARRVPVARLESGRSLPRS